MKNEKVIDNDVVRRSDKYPNYGCSLDGTVYRWDTEREIAIALTGGARDGSDPYMTFRTCHNNKMGTGFVHVIVADCWIPNDDPVNKTQVNHKDGNKRNPVISNLEWVTPSQNQRHAVSTGLKKKGQDLYNSSLTHDQVHLVCQKLVDGQRPIDIADLFDCSVDIVRKIRAGDCYADIRVLYNIPHKYKNTFSESTVRWVCDMILQGYSDKAISEQATNKKLFIIEVKRIRNKIRYRAITDEYF